MGDVDDTVESSSGRTGPTGGIVVGIDGSAGSSAALRWALAAAGEDRRVRPVFGWQYPYTVWVPAGIGGAPAPSAELMQAEAEAAAASMLENIDTTWCDEPIVVRGYPGVVLTDAAADADMLVVGTRGHGALASSLLGSVGRFCADHTTAPLVIVPEDDNDHEPPRTIAVGVDGSDNSDAALQWAIRFAGPDDTIRAVNAWNFIVGIAYSRPPMDPRKIAAASRDVVEEAADRACEAVGVDGSRVVREIADGDPRRVMHDLQSEVDLIVVGSRGRTGLAHLVLGSTTSAIIHHPKCPVAIVPHP
jgi:nucleotide-binding universal stress UspA family protein